MGTSNQVIGTTITALEDMSTDGHQYHAIALDDGKLANTGEEAFGILINKPKTNEFATVTYIGEEKFAAGGSITKGGKITVGTSGWFTAGDSGDYIVGECKETITSGSIGVGMFNFPTAPYLSV